ncbi:MAG: RNA polymerase factor sigma-54 [Gammaproteobacteria bacterium]
MKTQQRHTTYQKPQMHVQLSHAIRLMTLTQIELQALIEETLNENPLLNQDTGEDTFVTPVTANVREPTVYTEPGTLFTIENPVSLRDKLMWQCELTHFSPEEFDIACVLIDAIDENGYLPTPLDRLFDKASAPENLNALILHALHKIQGFEPIGIGARDLKECLMLQLQALSVQDDTTDLAMHLVHDHLEHLYKTTVLAKKVAAPAETLHKALALIQTLDPKPGRQESAETADLIMPDLKLSFDEMGEPVVTLIPYGHYAITINETIARAAKNHPELNQSLVQAKQFIEQLEMRHQTLLAVGRAIVAIQKDFFISGALMLRPLTLQTIADTLGYHPSTLSRVTMQKYIDTPRGIFELKYFFSGCIRSSGKPLASTAVKTLIEELVSTENQAEPLTDDALTGMLQAQGVKIARRTVTKYREALRIPSCLYRKH